MSLPCGRCRYSSSPLTDYECYAGFWYGFGGATIAMILLQSSLVFLAEPLELLAQSYRDDFALQGPGAGGVLFLLLMGSILGIAGALVAVSRHLRLIEPR